MAAGATSILTPLQALARSETQSGLEEFRTGLEGSVTTVKDEDYEIRRQSLIWNLIKPRRYPAMIVHADSVQDVILTVDFAHRHNYRISVRCGGHNYVSSFLVDAALVLDVSRLQGIEVDPMRRTTKAGPGVRSMQLLNKLGEYELSFPTAHSGYVALGGYLLGGGLGWNGDAWGGVACLNIEEVEVVTADGDLVTANEHTNADLYWAARGAGPCFFGVVTSFTLKLYEKPKAVLSSTYVWSVEDAEEACAWAYEKAAQGSDFVETWFALAAMPEADPDSAPAHKSDKVCMMLARAFADDETSAKAALMQLASVDQEVSARCLARYEFVPTSVIELTHETDAEAPPWRWAVDNLWTDDPPQSLAARLIPHMSDLPSDKSSILFVFKPHLPELPDAALSMVGKTYVGSFNIWMDPEDDRKNIQWRDRAMSLIEPHTKGHYINESNFLAVPSRVEHSFSAPHWQKLKSLREKYDPDRLFYTQLG